MMHRYGVVISYEQAQLNLDSFASIYLAFTPEVLDTSTPNPAKGRGGS